MRARLLAGAAGVTWSGSGTGLLLAGATGKQGMAEMSERLSRIPHSSPVSSSPAQPGPGQFRSSQVRPDQTKSRVLAPCC